MGDEKGLKPVEIAKVLFLAGAGICEDYEDDEKVSTDEIFKRVQELIANLIEEAND